MKLGAKLAKLRRQKRQSLQDVADAVGVSKAHIWEMEKGIADNPSMMLITRLADHFGITIASLMGEEIESSDSPKDLQRMFRQAQQLDPRELAILDDMMKSLLKRRTESE